MRYRTYLSTTCASSDHLPNVVRELTGYGFRHIELSGHLTYHSHFEADVLDYYCRGIRFLVHHYCPLPKMPFVLNIASANEVMTKIFYDGQRLAKERFGVQAWCS